MKNNNQIARKIAVVAALPLLLLWSSCKVDPIEDPNNPGLGPNFTRPFVGQAGLTFTPIETALISRFNPLPGAPPAAAGAARMIAAAACA